MASDFDKLSSVSKQSFEDAMSNTGALYFYQCI